MFAASSSNLRKKCRIGDGDFVRAEFGLGVDELALDVRHQLFQMAQAWIAANSHGAQ